MRGQTITAAFKNELSNYVNVLSEDKKAAQIRKSQAKTKLHATVANQTKIEKKALKIALIEAITTHKAKKAAYKAAAKVVKPLLKAEEKVQQKAVKKASQAVAIPAEKVVPAQNKTAAKVKKTVSAVKTQKTESLKKNKVIAN